MAKIFLSYRREDSADVAGRIFDHLERRFGRDRLFLDMAEVARLLKNAQLKLRATDSYAR